MLQQFSSKSRRSVASRSAIVFLLGGMLGAIVFGQSCAAGNELGTGGTADASSDDSSSAGPTTSSAGGTTGTSSGSSTSGGTGGEGGHGGAGSSSTSGVTAASSSTSNAATSSSSGIGGGASSSATGGSGSSGSSGSGGSSPTGTVLLLAGGGQTILGGEFHPGTGWTTTVLNDATSDGPSIAEMSGSAAVGVIRSKSGNGELRYTSWTPGSWTAFKMIAPLETTSSTPSIFPSGARADLAFRGDNTKHYYAAYTSGAWAPLAEPIQLMNAPQIQGPSPSSVTAIGSDTIVAFAGDDGELYDQTRTGGVWQGAHGHALGNVVIVTPQIAALNGGFADLLVVFVNKSDSKLLFTKRAAGSWSVPMPIDQNTFSTDPVGLAALPGGKAALAFRGLDGKVYASRYDPNGAPVWSVPGPIANPNYATPSSPAIAGGVGGMDAELVFVNSADGAAYHTRLASMTWSPPILVGGVGATHVGVTSSP
jgi:hypothetical protein